MTQFFDKNVIFLIFGIPGAGKGTVSGMIASRNKGVSHFAPGDLYRSYAKKTTPFAMKIRKIINSGQLAPNELTNDIMIKQIESLKEKSLIILDGYPRTIDQMNMIDTTLEKKGCPIKFVINIVLDKEVAKKRITNRRVCEKCSATYNIEDAKGLTTCKSCNQELVLIKRKDDTDELYEKRYKWTMSEVQPVIDEYRRKLKSRFHDVQTDENSSIEDIYKEVKNIIQKYWEF